MKSFQYASPSDREEAARLLSEPGSVALAGGTDLLSLMKDGIIDAPQRLVNLKGVSDLSGIEEHDGGLRIGALTRLQDLLDDEAVRQRYPALWQSAHEIASPQMLGMGTIGGDLCQRPRCWYYRNGFGLLAAAEGRSLVAEGDNRYHAIFGKDGPAHFVNPSSLAPALVAFGATLSIFGPRGSRELEVEHFHRAPTEEGELEYKLENGEFVDAILIPRPRDGSESASYEVRTRSNMDWPLTSASVRIDRRGGKVESARVVLGHVAPIPWRSQEAEGQLVGTRLDEKSMDNAADAAVARAEPLSMNAYKVQLARVAVRRALSRAVGQEVSP